MPHMEPTKQRIDTPAGTVTITIQEVSADRIEVKAEVTLTTVCQVSQVYTNGMKQDLLKRARQKVVHDLVRQVLTPVDIVSLLHRMEGLFIEAVSYCRTIEPHNSLTSAAMVIMAQLRALQNASCDVAQLRK